MTFSLIIFGIMGIVAIKVIGDIVVKIISAKNPKKKSK